MLAPRARSPHSITRLEAPRIAVKRIEPTISASQCGTFHAFIRNHTADLDSRAVVKFMGNVACVALLLQHRNVQFESNVSSCAARCHSQKAAGEHSTKEIFDPGHKVILKMGAPLALITLHDRKLSNAQDVVVPRA